MSRLRWIAFSFAVLVLSISAPAQVQQSDSAHQEHHPPAASGAVQQADMMNRCKEMMAQQQAMAERKKQMNEKLGALVADMNRAPSKDQVGKIVAVINEMVAQREAMDQMMTAMQERMMMHAMEHAQSGTTMECPMMKQMQEKMGAGGRGRQ